MTRSIQRIQSLVAAGLSVNFGRHGITVSDERRGYVLAAYDFCLPGHAGEITDEQVERALSMAEAYVAAHPEHGHLCMCVECLSRASTHKPEVRR